MRISATKSFKAAAAALVFSTFATGAAFAQKKYDTGASDTEIKIGNIGPYSGPASAYAVIAKVVVNYFKMVNDAGGINGRKINIISLDDAYNPSKTVEQTRKLVEGDEVLAMAAVVGTATNGAIQKYLNQKGIPQLFAGSGAAKWADPKNFPWTIGWLPSYRNEGKIYAEYILKTYPGKKVAILYQNDDFGKDYILGFQDGAGAEKSRIVVAELPFDVSAPTVDSQVLQIKDANPDIFINVATPKFAAQAIKKIAELGWKPVQFVTNISVSVANTLRPAGLENAKGIMSAAYLKDPNDAVWKGDPGMMKFKAFMAKWYPDGDPSDSSIAYGYGVAQTLAQTLKQCGDDLTRANLMKQAANLDMTVDVTIPGVHIKTSPTDFSPIEQVQLMRFNGTSWDLFGSLMDGAGK